MPAELYIGTSGWSYPDWEGIFYPPGIKRSFNRLAYYAEHFDTVEINTSFYRPPNPDYCKKWLRDVAGNPRFMFTAKLWQHFTHERDKPWTPADVDVFRRSIEPLASAGKLGALLVQFPWSFRNGQRERQWLAGLAAAFKDYPRVLEVRHVSWQCEPALNFFRDLGLNFCNIDQPPTRNSIGPTSIATGDVAYYRFHGRNEANWFSKEANRDQRYDYLYSDEELQPWVDNITEMEKRIEQIYVMTNNHYRGQAPVNALQMQAMLGGKPRVPATLVEHYPVLKSLAK